MHSRSTRALTATELARLKRGLRLTADDVAWMVFPLGGAAAIGFFMGKLFDWIASKVGFQTGDLLTYALLSVMGCLGLVGSILVVRGFVQSRRSRRTEIRANTVEVIHVENARAVRVGSPDEEEPMVVFDIGDNKLMCLFGQWMYDPNVFEPRDADELFPSDSFSLSRLPESGAVIGVHILGKPLGQLREATLEEIGLRKIGNLEECTIFEGTLDLMTENP